MEGCVWNAPVFRCVLALEEGLIAIQPRQGVLLSIEGRELDACARVEAWVAVVVLGVPVREVRRLTEREGARR